MPPLEMIEVALALSLHCVVACSSRQESKIQEHVCDTLSTSQCILQPLLVSCCILAWRSVAGMIMDRGAD